MILTRKYFRKLLPDLEETLACKEDFLSKEEEKDSPNEARVEFLDAEIQTLSSIIEYVEEYVELSN